MPTFNRATYIEEAVTSILSDAPDCVELVIVDGGSSDGTDEIIHKLQGWFANLVYIKKTTNGGVDEDMSEAIENARGQFCWIASSDDVLDKGAVSRLLDVIKTDCDVYLANRLDCDLAMRPFKRTVWLPQLTKDKRYDFNRSSDLRSYLDASSSIGSIFSFAPSIMVKRQKWIDNDYSKLFYGNKYAHVHRLMTILRDQGSLYVLHKPLVLCRMDNESLTVDNLAQRYLIDFAGYAEMGRDVFSNDPETLKSFLGVVRREHKWYRIAKLRAYSSDTEWRTIQPYLDEFGYSKPIQMICRFLGLFPKPLQFFVALKRRNTRRQSSTTGQWDN